MRSANRLGNGLLLLTLVSGSAGCFLDEIDKAGSWQKAEKPKPEATAPAQQQGSTQKQTNWWATATSLGSEESKTDIVRCIVGNSTQFMGRDDCRARGGKVK